MVLETAPQKEFADWQTIDFLRRRKKAGTLGRLQLTKSLWLRKDIAQELGFNAGDEDFLLEAGIKLQPTIITPPFVPEGITPRPLPGVTPTTPLTFPEITLTGDYGLLFKEYQRTGGTLDVVSWGAAGSPLRPDMEAEQTDEGLQRFLNDLVKAGQISDVENMLRLGGAPEEEIDRIVGVEARQQELEGLVAKTFPELDLEGFANLLETDLDAFLDKIRTGGRTKEKQDLLRLMGFGWEDIGEVFKVQKIVTSVGGIRKLVTFDENTGRAFDQQGKFIGAFDPITREIRPLTLGEQVRDFKDAWTLASIGAWERTKEFALTQIPKLLFRDMTPLERKIQGDEWANETDRRNKELRDTWRATASEEKQKYEDWVRKNPKLAPRPDYEEGASVHPELWKDPWWWAYEVASMAPASATALLVGIGTTALTGGNWIAGAVAAGATFYPQEVIGVRDDLLSEGIPEDQVDEIALIVGVPIVMMESAGRLPLMWGVSPTLKRLFRKEATTQIVRLTKRELVKRGILTFTGNQFGETMTEVLQEAIGNAAVKLAGADRSLFENLDVIAAKTFAGVAPTSLFGGMGAMVRISPSQTKGLSNAEMKAKGWVQDPKVPSNWYEKAREALEIAPERGAIGGQFISGERWEAMSVSERSELAKSAGLEGKLGSKAWADLSLPEKQALARQPIPEKVTPAPRVTKIQPTYENLTEGQTLVNQAGERWLIIGIKKEGVPARWAYIIKIDTEKMKLTRTVPLGEIERYYKIEQQPTIPKAVPEKVTPPEVTKFDPEYIAFLKTIEGKTTADFTIKKVTGAGLANWRAVDNATGIDIGGANSRALAQDVVNQILANKARLVAIPKAEVTPAPEVTKLPRELKGLAEKATNLSKAEFITQYQAGLAEQNLTRRETAQKIDAYIKRTLKITPEQFYDTFVKPLAKAEAAPAQTWTETGIQPSMLPEDVAAIEVRPPAKGKITQISMDDQLKLEQAKKAAEEAEAEESENAEAYQAQWEIEGIKAVHKVDPVAQWRTTETATRKTKQPDGSYKLTEYKRQIGFDSFISIKEREFPETFTVKQAKLIDPLRNYSRWLQKETKEYNKVPRDVLLDPIASELGFTGTTAVEDLVARINQVRREKQQLKDAEQTIRREMTERPLALEKEVEDISDLIRVRGEPLYTIEQIDVLSLVMGEYLVNPNTINAYKVVRQYQSLERARRFKNVASRRQDIIVTEGLSWEEAHNKAMDEFARGKLPSLTLEGLEDITAELRDVFFAKVHHTFDQLGSRYEGERWATITALTNALAGIPIPMEKGKGSILFPEGGSAWDRLNYVFGKQPRLMEGLTKTAKQKKSLKDVTEGIFKEVPEGGMPPIPIDQEMADYLRNLSLVYDQIKLGEQPAELQFQIMEDVRNLPSDLKIEDARTKIEKIIEMRQKGLLPIPPVTRYEAPIDDAFKRGQLWPRPVRDNIIRALKELGMLPVDIGNFLRANKASVDFSFWRQQAPLIASHPISFAQANVEAWRAIWSQKSAEASWIRITRDPPYQMYEEAAAAGGDFLRPVLLPKGTAQWRGTEEYGYSKGVERLLPRFTAALPWVKLSARAFETGTNVHNWLIFKSYYRAMLKYSEQIASGQKKLKAGEAFDIQKEMVDFSKSLANFSARGSLGKFAATAPELSGLFFAPRAAIGRILSVKDLINANPRVRLEAWKNASTFVGTFGGLILLGAAMGWWEVEKDPRNAEYMSIRIGNTRIDPWGGYRQFLVFFARAITQTGVSSVTGAEYEVDPIHLIQTFIRGKASPLASLILDFWRGKTFIGEEVDVANKRQWAERVAPFAVWDIYEAYKDDPIHGLQAVIPAILGAGVQTYTGDWKENFKKLGLPKYSDNLAYGLTEPKYDTADFWSDHSADFKGVDPATLTKEKGFPDYIRAVVEARVIKEHLESLPSERLVSLNADTAKGATFGDYYRMWKDREVIVASGDEDALKAFDQDERTRNANLGNFSQRQFALLSDYWLITDKKKQAAFLEEHKAEIGIKPRDEYLRTHPKENAQLAVWGQAKILTKEAYNQFKGMIKELDIPDSALPKLTLPPETSLETHWNYEDMVSAGTHSSWEAQLLLKRDYMKAHPTGKVLEGEPQSYTEWRTTEGEALKLSDTPIASLELKVKNRANFDRLDGFSDKDSPDYIADEKARAEAIKKFRADNPEFVDDTRRIEAIEKGTDDNPISDMIIKNHLEYGKIQDKEGVGSSSAESMLYRVDNPGYDKFRIDETIWGDNALKPIDQSRIPIWRIDVKMAGLDEDSPEYALLSRQRDAHTNGFSDMVDTYVGWYDTPKVGYYDDWFLMENKDFYDRMVAQGLLTVRDFSKVPDIKWRDEWDTMPPRKQEAIINGVPEQYTNPEAEGNPLDDYVAYFEIPPKPDDYPSGFPNWEDDWWMMEHPDFYKEVYLGILGNQRKDYRKVPTRAVWAKYLIYDGLDFRADQDKYRLDNPDLDAWGVLYGIWTETMTEKRRRRTISEAERISAEIEERLKKLKEAVGSR